MHVTKGSINHIISLERNIKRSRILSTMQLNNGLKSNETRFMTTLKDEVVPSKMDVPKYNKNMTSPELHKKFHLKRKVDRMMEKWIR